MQKNSGKNRKKTPIDTIVSIGAPVLKMRLLREHSSLSSALMRIGDSIGSTCLAMRYPHMAAYHGMECVYEFVDWQNKKEQQRQLRLLREKKLIAIRKIGDKYMVRFLDRGKREYFRQRVLNAELLDEGRYCLVVFDIPEDRRDVRQQLRRLLSMAAFIPIQKSVWASPFNAANQLSDYLRINGGRDWVRIFIADEVRGVVIDTVGSISVPK